MNTVYTILDDLHRAYSGHIVPKNDLYTFAAANYRSRRGRDMSQNIERDMRHAIDAAFEYRLDGSYFIYPLIKI